MRLHPLWALAALPVLSACVTVNIYFPAAAAEKVADRIVRDVYTAGEQGKVRVPHSPATGGTSQGHARPGAGGPPATAPTSSAPVPPQSAISSPEQLAQALLNAAFTAVSGTAEAAEANIDISSPAITRLRQSMQARAPQLQPLLDSGAVGLTDNGLLILRDAAKLPLAQRAQANGLVQAENQDRLQLYQAIAQANGHPNWATDIQQTFAASWIRNAHGGWWYQAPGGAWQQK